MTDKPSNNEIPRRIQRKVSILRWLIRGYVALEGLAIFILILASAFWIGLALDWSFEPSREIRLLLFVGLGIVLTIVAFKKVLARTFARLSDTSLALLMERTFPEFNDSLVTTIESQHQDRADVPRNEQLLNQTRDIASERIEQVRLGDVFRLRPLVWKTLAAVFLLISICVFAVWQNESFGFWIDRLQLSEAPWPRRVHLTVDGFEPEGDKLVAHVARDDDFDLRVLAAITDGHSVPESVEIRYRLLDGRGERQAMTKIGEALPGRDDAQEFHFVFNKVSELIRFNIQGGDDRIRSLELRVVERPQIVGWKMECQPPSYLQRAPYTESFSRRIELEEGTHAICRLDSNKKLAEIEVREPAQEKSVSVVISEDNPMEVSFPVEVYQEDRVFLINMRDEEGVENKEPYRMVVSAIADAPPEVSVQLRGIGSAVTPQAVIPFEGRVKDQYGLQELWFEYQVDQGELERRYFASRAYGKLEMKRLDSFDLRQTVPETDQRLLDLHPGQKISLAVQASDAYDLVDTPHIGSSPRFLLNVVTESELRALLEKRELALRQRFEALFEKMVGIHELLLRIDIREDSLADATDETEKDKVRDLLRLDGATQNIIQISYETIGVAEGFQDIVDELVNNRIDTEELKQRLVDGIANPVLEIGEELLPDMETQLLELQEIYQDKGNAVVSYEKVLNQGEIVLEAMQNVLDRMLELENYNELVELLRGIVKDHKELQEHTKQKRRDKLRSLLDDE